MPAVSLYHSVCGSISLAYQYIQAFASLAIQHPSQYVLCMHFVYIQPQYTEKHSWFQRESIELHFIRLNFQIYNPQATLGAVDTRLFSCSTWVFSPYLGYFCLFLAHSISLSCSIFCLCGIFAFLLPALLSHMIQPLLVRNSQKLKVGYVRTINFAAIVCAHCFAIAQWKLYSTYR